MFTMIGFIFNKVSTAHSWGLKVSTEDAVINDIYLIFSIVLVLLVYRI